MIVVTGSGEGRGRAWAKTARQQVKLIHISSNSLIPDHHTLQREGKQHNSYPSYEPQPFYDFIPEALFQ
jgi:hypothetical protein